jgi:hypothetical protein
LATDRFSRLAQARLFRGVTLMRTGKLGIVLISYAWPMCVARMAFQPASCSDIYRVTTPQGEIGLVLVPG